MSDIYETVTNSIIAALEAGVTAGDYSTPWTGGHATHRPKNATTGTAYKGVNVLALWASAEANDYASGEWATYKQWQAVGAQVRKGEKSTQIVFWQKLPGKTNDAGEETKGGMMAKSYFVFNASQVDGWTANDMPELPETTRIAYAEEYFGKVGATILPGSGACYVPSLDVVKMPAFAAFHDATSYYSVLAHELTHWTGSEKRLNRDLKNRFGTEAYAAEELVAELGAAFTCATLGLSAEPRKDHAAYIASWLKVLKGDKRAIFTAAAKAQQAVDYLSAE